VFVVFFSVCFFVLYSLCVSYRANRSDHSVFKPSLTMSAATTDAVLILQGFMTKQGSLHKSWKKRWFCNSFEDPFTLSYYTDDTLKTLKGTVDLREVYHFRTKYDTKERGPKQRVGIALVTPSRTWKLIAVGSTNGDYWTQGLERLIHLARNPSSGDGAVTATGSASPAPTPANPQPSAPAAQPSKPAPEAAEKEESSPASEGEKKPAKKSSKERPTATALFEYTAANVNELSFNKGDKLTILQRDEEAGWWAAELNGKKGWVSSFYVQIDN